MSQSPYRVLRIVLGFLSLVFAIAGVVLILSNKPLILRMFMHPPQSEITTLLLAAVKEMGGIVLMLSVMLFLASRDPERNVAIIDGMAVGLCILALTPLLSLYTLDVRRLYPSSLIWLRSLVRLALAGLLFQGIFEVWRRESNVVRPDTVRLRPGPRRRETGENAEASFPLPATNENRVACQVAKACTDLRRKWILWQKPGSFHQAPPAQAYVAF